MIRKLYFQITYTIHNCLYSYPKYQLKQKQRTILPFTCYTIIRVNKNYLKIYLKRI